MRWILGAAATLTFAIHAMSSGWLGLSLPGKLDPEVRAALRVRCGSLDEPSLRSCERSLSNRIAGGSIDPAAILRMHCTRWQGPWGQVTEQPPPICDERYGGWIRG
jgi:hypothetical protein